MEFDVGELPAGWSLAKVGELSERVSVGYVSSTRDYFCERGEGVPLIRSQNIRPGRLVLEDTAWVTRAFHDANPKSQLRPGDVLITRVGANAGDVCIVPEGQGEMHLSSAVFARPKPQHRKYIELFFRSPLGQYILKSRIVGSVSERINTRDFEVLPVLLPPPPEEAAIAHILGTLDDKIELNRRMNETLEAMARVHFSSWFRPLDLRREPVSDLIDEGVLEIGDGYRAKNSELGSDGLPFVRAGDLNNGFDTRGADILSRASVARVGNKISRVGDVAFTSKGTVGRFARVTKYTDPFVYSPQICFWRSLAVDRLHPAILYCWMRSEDLLRQIMAVAGQTDMALYVSLRDQRKMQVPRFSTSQQKVAARIESVLDRQALANYESRTLAAIRDTLLPKLISGELRVKDAEKIAARVT